MTHTLSPVLRIGHWLLPWVVVVFASATLAYGLNGAVLAGPNPEVTRQSCPPIGDGYGSFVDSLIVAESRRIACGQGAP